MAVWPQVVARLVAHLPTLPGWSGVVVYDGEPVTADDPRDYVTVGYVPGEDFAGSYEQDREQAAWSVVESGTVRSRLVSTTGDSDLPGRRARVFALADAWEQWVTESPTLGVLSPSSRATVAVDVEPAQDTSGSAVALIVTVNYVAHI